MRRIIMCPVTLLNGVIVFATQHKSCCDGLNDTLERYCVLETLAVNKEESDPK